MASFVIEGGHKLHGEIVPQGAKMKCCRWFVPHY